MNIEQAMKLTRGTADKEGHFFKFWMPYAFQKLDAGGRANVYLPVNRNYKPLGVLQRDFVDYEGFAASHAVKFARDPRTFDNIWSAVHGDTLWLYDDGSETRKTYFARFERLMLKSMPLLGGEG